MMLWRTPFKVQRQASLHQNRSEQTTAPGCTTLPAWCARLKCNLVTNLQTFYPFPNFQNHPAYRYACCGHIRCELGIFDFDLKVVDPGRDSMKALVGALCGRGTNLDANSRNLPCCFVRYNNRLFHRPLCQPALQYISNSVTARTHGSELDSAHTLFKSWTSLPQMPTALTWILTFPDSSLPSCGAGSKRRSFWPWSIAA